MKTDNPNLRRRAEEFLDRNPGAVSKIPAGDLYQLIEDLHIHQIELEMQNEELRRAQLEIEKARDRYSDLYDFAPVGYFTISDKGLILEANLNGTRLLNIERRSLINGAFNRLIPSHHQDKFYLHCNAVFKSKTNQTCDLELVRKDGTQFYARLESVAIQEEAGNSRQIRTAVTDISDRVQAREALRQSEEKYRLLFNEMISGYALHEIIFDSKGKPVDSLILEANKTIEWHTGLKRDQIIGKTVREVLPDTEQDWFEKFAEVVKTGNPIQFENYHQQLDKHFMVSAFRLPEGQLAATFTDITDRRRFQKELQKAHDELEKRVEERTANLVSLNEQLQQEIEERKQAEEALEVERQRLYSVLDELPAFVYLEAADHSLRFANRYFRERFGDCEGKKCYELLRGIKASCKECPTLKVIETGKPQVWEGLELRDERSYQIYDYPFTDIDGSQLVLELGIDITKRKQAESELRRLSSRLLKAQEDERRRIAFELRDELGQDLTVLKLHIDSIKRKLHQDQSALHKAFEKDLFSTDQQIAIYRIFQEIFTNISKHARATQLSIKISKEDNKVFFSLNDNGIGFNIEQIKARYAPDKGLGLAAMEERIKMLNGRIEIFSQEGKGTRIGLEIPVDNPL